MFLANLIPSLFFLVAVCTPVSKTKNTSQINGLSLTQELEVFANSQKAPNTLSWQTDIYSRENKLLYVDHYDFFLMNNGTMETKKLHNFFLHEKNSFYGYFFDECKPVIDTCQGYTGSYKIKLPADSFFKKQWYNSKIDILLFKPYLVLKNNHYTADKSILYQEYEFNKKNGDTLVTGALQLGYSADLKMPFEYTISGEFDTVKNFKLSDISLNIKTYVQLNDANKTVDSSKVKFVLKINVISDQKQTESFLKYFNTPQKNN